MAFNGEFYGKKMNILIDIDFVSGHEYYGRDTEKEYLSKQWEPRIVSITNLSFGCGDNHDFRTGDITLILMDFDNQFRDKINDINNRHMSGRDAIIYYHDGIAGTKLRTMQIFKAVPIIKIVNNHPVKLFKIVLSEQFLKKDLYDPGSLDEEFVSTIPDESRAAKINHTFGRFGRDNDFGDVTRDTVKAWRIASAGANRYFIGITHPDMDDGGGTFPNYIFKPDGTDISQLCTTNKVGDYWYIDYTDTEEDYLLTHLEPIADYFFLELLEDIMSRIGVLYDTSHITNIFDREKSRGFNNKIFSFSANNNPIDHRYIIDKIKRRDKIIQEICENIEMDYYINTDQEVVFRALLYEDLTEDRFIQTGGILSYQLTDIDTQRQETKTDARYGRNPASGTFEINNDFNNFDAQSRSGLTLTKKLELNFNRYMPANVNPAAFVPAKFRVLLRRNGLIKCKIKMALPDGFGINPLDKIKFAHPDAISTGERTYWVRKVTYDFKENQVFYDLWDIDDAVNNMYHGAFLWIPSNNNDGSQVFFNHSHINSYVLETPGNIEHSTLQTKFSNSSLYFQGISDADRIQINRGVGTSFLDPIKTGRTNFIFASWIRIDNTLTDSLGIFSGEVDSENRWFIRFRGTGIGAPNNVIQFFYRESDIIRIDLRSDAVIVAADTWYFLVVAKIGDDFAIYVDGQQEAFVTFAGGPYDLAFVSNYGIKTDAGGLAEPFEGWWQDPIIMFDNDLWNLNPNVGKTNTHPVPTKSFNDYGFQ